MKGAGQHRLKALFWRGTASADKPLFALRGVIDFIRYPRS
jgi:hypothetical protein